MTDARPPITSKSKMYQLLSRGALGNTIPQFFSLKEWQEGKAVVPNYGLWGVRSARRGGDKKMRLNVPEEEVTQLWNLWYPFGGGNISPMIDRWAVLRAEVMEDAWGLKLFYVPPGKLDEADPWRGSFRSYGEHAYGLLAKMLLKQYLWPSDQEDLRVLLDSYPGHVVEFSACDRAVGLIPNRNMVVWEVRLY